MKLPSRMIDLSSPLENETVYDPPFMRPKIEYRTNADTAPRRHETDTGSPSWRARPNRNRWHR